MRDDYGDMISDLEDTIHDLEYQICDLEGLLAASEHEVEQLGVALSDALDEIVSLKDDLNEADAAYDDLHQAYWELKEAADAQAG